MPSPKDPMMSPMLRIAAPNSPWFSGANIEELHEAIGRAHCHQRTPDSGPADGRHTDDPVTANCTWESGRIQSSRSIAVFLGKLSAMELFTIIQHLYMCDGIYLVLSSNTLSLMWGPYLV